MGLVYPSLYLFLNQKRFPTGESFYGERAKPRTEGELQDLSPTVILRQFTWRETECVRRQTEGEKKQKKRENTLEMTMYFTSWLSAELRAQSINQSIMPRLWRSSSTRRATVRLSKSFPTGITKTQVAPPISALTKTRRGRHGGFVNGDGVPPIKPLRAWHGKKGTT